MSERDYGVLLLPLWPFPPPPRARAAPTTPPAMRAMPPGVRQKPAAFGPFPSNVQAYPFTGLFQAGTLFSWFSVGSDVHPSAETMPPVLSERGSTTETT